MLSPPFVPNDCLHQAYLVRLIQAHLEENSMKKLQFSTLKRLLKLLPAADAREIKGLDPKYELHRRAFIDLQEICTELHKKFTSKDDEKNIDLVEKVQQGLATSASYLLGHFVYNLSENSKCASHDINFACSDSKNSKSTEHGFQVPGFAGTFACEKGHVRIAEYIIKSSK